MFFCPWMNRAGRHKGQGPEETAFTGASWGHSIRSPFLPFPVACGSQLREPAFPLSPSLFLYTEAWGSPEQERQLRHAHTPAPRSVLGAHSSGFYSWDLHVPQSPCANGLAPSLAWLRGGRTFKKWSLRRSFPVTVWGERGQWDSNLLFSLFWPRGGQFYRAANKVCCSATSLKATGPTDHGLIPQNCELK